jgi:hypothetical protein
MKRKVHYQVQSTEIVPPRGEQVHEEIRNFLLALDSYHARVAKEPRIRFHQHLSSIFAARSDSDNSTDTEKARRDQRTRRQ